MKKVWISIASIVLLTIPLTGCAGLYTQDELDSQISIAEDAGYQRGYDKGHFNGYEEGYDEGEYWGELFAYENGYAEGYDDGYSEGEDDGYTEGQESGYNRGHDSGYEQGYQNGFWAGEDEASGTYEFIAEDNYAQGYIEGYEDCQSGDPSIYATNHDVPDLFVEIISVTSPVSRGNYATLKAETLPDILCNIKVYYESGLSEAMGLYPHDSDDNGDISWQWLVGGNTTPGEWLITVTAYDLDNWFTPWPFATDSTYFEVQ